MLDRMIGQLLMDLMCNPSPVPVDGNDTRMPEF